MFLKSPEGNVFEYTDPITVVNLKSRGYVEVEDQKKSKQTAQSDSAKSGK